MEERELSTLSAVERPRPFIVILFCFEKALKAISDTEIMQEKGKKAMEKGNLEEAYNLYTSYLTKLDKHLAPPYPDYYRIQQSIWKCIWMRFGNRIVRSKAVKPAVSADDYDTVD